jgi:large subunit ribosomal protein L5e
LTGAKLVLVVMAFVKVLKNKSYFKRYQVQKRRRRQGKTDFQARRKMVRQDKNKYNNRKYRLVVRFTNRKITCQVAYATIGGDKVVAQATSTELTKFGIPIGHKNYGAAYATGLLIARRTLKKFGMDGTFKGKEELNGEEYHVEEEEADQRPFKCIFDVGLRRTVTGARMWGALKGAVDGGLHVPHNSKNFPGYKPSEEKGAEAEYDAEAHKDRIFGGHVKEYMEMLQEEDPTKYEAHFSKFLENDIDAEKMEDMYTAGHAKIRENPDYEPTAKKGTKWERKGNTVTGDGKDVVRSVKLSLKQRKQKVAIKIQAAQAKMLAGAEDDE